MTTAPTASKIHRLLCLTLGTLLSMEGPALSFISRASAQNRDEAKTNEAISLAKVELETGTIEIKDFKTTHTFQMTGADGEPIVVSIDETPKEELRKFSPEKVTEKLRQAQELNRSDSHNRANLVRAQVQQIKTTLLQGSNKPGSPLIQALDHLAKSDLERKTFDQIKSSVTEIKYYASTTYKSSKAVDQLNAMKAFAKLQFSLDQAEAKSRQRHKAMNMPRGLIKQTAMRFPVESLLFNAAMGMVMAIQLSARYQENPLGMEQTLESLKTPEAHLGFFAFMLANSAVSPHLQKVLTKPWARPMIPYLGMTAGMMASNVVHDSYNLIFHKGLLKCVNGMLGDLSPSETEKACAESYEELAVDRKVLQYGGGLVSLFAATFASGAIQKGGSQLSKKLVQKIKLPGNQLVKSSRVFAWTGARILARMNSVGWAITGAHYLGKVAQFTGFVGIDTMINPTIMRAGGNLWTGGLLNSTEDDIIDRLQAESPKYDSMADSSGCTTEKIKPRASYSTPRKSCNTLLASIKDLKHHLQSWQTMLMERASAAHLSWLDKTNKVISGYTATENFYGFILSLIEAKKMASPLELSELDRKMPLNGVEAYGIPEELKGLYLIAVDYTFIQQLTTLQRSLHTMDGFIASQKSLNAQAELSPKISNWLKELTTEFDPEESLEELKLRQAQWQKQLALIEAEIKSNSTLAQFMAPLKQMGLNNHNKQEIPLRISYALKPYLEGALMGFERPLQRSREVEALQKLRNQLSLKGDSQQGDAIASALIVRQTLNQIPLMKTEVTSSELAMLKNESVELHFGAMRLMPEKYFSSYVSAINHYKEKYKTLFQASSAMSGQNFTRLDQTIYSILSQLGNPNPTMIPGQGILYVYEKLFPDVTEAKNFWSTYQKGSGADSMIYSMICGPDLLQNQSPFALNLSGFSDHFSPPRLVNGHKTSTIQAYCREQAQSQIDNLYTQPIENSSGALAYIEQNILTEARTFSARYHDSATSWLQKTLTPDLKQTYQKWGEEYRMFVAQMLTDALIQGKEKLNLGNMSNGYLENLKQERRFYIGLLGEIARATKRDDLQVSSTEINYQKSESLFTDLAMSPIYNLSSWISGDSAMGEGSLLDQYGSQSENVYGFQTQIDSSFEELEELYRNVEVIYENRKGPLGALTDQIKLKKVRSMRRGFTAEEIQEKGAMIDLNLELIAATFGYSFEGEEIKPAVDNLPYTQYQSELILESLMGLKRVQQNYGNLSNIMTALDPPQAL